MRHSIYTRFAVLIVALASLNACKKQDVPKPVVSPPTIEPVASPDYVSRMAGEWRCSGTNNAAHVAFTTPTDWIALDTALVLIDHLLKIEKVGDNTLQVTCMGYDQYMAYANVGRSFLKCSVACDSTKLEFVQSNYEPMYGYGSGARLTYYITQDSIFYYADYKSNIDKFELSVKGGRK